MQSKYESTDILSLISYRRYREEKYNNGKQNFAKFSLKLAIINENPASKLELMNMGTMFQKAENYKQAIECYKILHFNDKKGFQSRLDLMLYQAVEKNDLTNVLFMVRSGANIKINSKHSTNNGIGDLLYPDLPPSIMPGQSLLHIACHKDNPEMVKLLLTLGVPLFEKNRFNKIPREVNKDCFDKAWVEMHYEGLYKSFLVFLISSDKSSIIPSQVAVNITENLINLACENLNISLESYQQITKNAMKSLILSSIQDKYLEILQKDESQAFFKSPVVGLPNLPTLKDVISNAFKNVNQFYSSALGLFRQEDRTLRALKELNFITEDNQLSNSAPNQFKDEFKKVFSSSAEFALGK